MVDRFLVAWLGDETYLPTLATRDVLDVCRAGVGGFSNWDPGDVAETAPGTFELSVELLAKGGPIGTLVFVVGPGTAADSSQTELIMIDVRPR